MLKQVVSIYTGFIFLVALSCLESNASREGDANGLRAVMHTELERCELSFAKRKVEAKIDPCDGNSNRSV